MSLFSWCHLHVTHKIWNLLEKVDRVFLFRNFNWLDLGSGSYGVVGYLLKYGVFCWLCATCGWEVFVEGRCVLLATQSCDVIGYFESAVFSAGSVSCIELCPWWSAVLSAGYASCDVIGDLMKFGICCLLRIMACCRVLKRSEEKCNLGNDVFHASLGCSVSVTCWFAEWVSSELQFMSEQRLGCTICTFSSLKSGNNERRWLMLICLVSNSFRFLSSCLNFAASYII